MHGKQRRLSRSLDELREFLKRMMASCLANSGKRDRPSDNSEQRFSRATSRALPADRGAPRRQASSGGVVAKESKGAGRSTSWDCMTSHLVKLSVRPIYVTSLSDNSLDVRGN